MLSIRRFLTGAPFLSLVPILVVLLPLGHAPSGGDFSLTQMRAPSSAGAYADRAVRTQRFTFERLAYLSGSDSCLSATSLSFRRELGSEQSDAWYNASQIMADAAMLQLGQATPTCTVGKSVAFIDLLSRSQSEGGYYPRANVDGTAVTTRDTFADDNALIGLAFLEARAASRDDAWRAALLERAAGASAFLLRGSLWDDTFGGGFWWNTNRGTMAEGKPAQTTALAVLLFGRLYEETGQQQYADWARRGLTWLDERLFDPALGLYRYGYRHLDTAALSGEYLDPRFFGYDQGIMIELHLVFDRVVAPKAGHLGRARALARALQSTFWEPERGGYRLQAELPDVYAGYSAWLTQSLLALYAVDPDPAWLGAAQANLDALEAHLLDPADGGYFLMQYRCNADEDGCANGATWARDPTKLLFSQAWMQRAQALLATTLRESSPVTEAFQNHRQQPAIPIVADTPPVPR